MHVRRDTRRHAAGTHAKSLSPSMQSTLSRASLLALSVFIADVNAFASRNSARGRPLTAMPSSLHTTEGKPAEGVDGGGEGEARL